jgi:hypothetical protein
MKKPATPYSTIDTSPDDRTREELQLELVGQSIRRIGDQLHFNDQIRPLLQAIDRTRVKKKSTLEKQHKIFDLMVRLDRIYKSDLDAHRPTWPQYGDYIAGVGEGFYGYKGKTYSSKTLRAIYHRGKKMGW